MQRMQILVALAGSMLLAVTTLAVDLPFVATDECDFKLEVFEVADPDFDITSFTTVGATTSGPDHSACADSAGDGQVYNDVWFDFVAQADGVLTISLTGSTFDTKIAVYDTDGFGNCAADDQAYSDALVACNDNCGGAQSKVSFSTVLGRRYVLRIGGASSSASGHVQMSFTRADASVASLRAAVAALAGAPLNSGQVNSLTKKLDLSAAQLKIGRTTPAINRLKAFVGEVNGLTPDVLSASQAQALIDAANQLIDSISC